jgi:pyruvate,water dikinase
MAQRMIIPLNDVGTDDVALVGGKGANLGELTRAGFLVPAGFVVTTHAYRSTIETIGLDEHIASVVDDDGSAIRRHIAELEMPPGIAEQISEAYERLGGQVAVRSSATAEDLPGAAFAGQQDTYLGIVGVPDVLSAVRSCWASLWNDRAIAYRRRLSMDTADIAIAVVVQTMVPADAAGVMFTADPVTGIRERVVIDANAGLGESVVSGLVTPDHYVIGRDGATLTWSAGKREVIISSDHNGGTMHSRGHASGEPLLSSQQRAELAALGRAVAAHFGCPQDIEWALADDAFRLLQARPMTALPIPHKLSRVQKLIGSVFSDYFTVRPYPLDMTTWVPFGPLGLMDRVLASVGIRSHFDTILPQADGVVVQFVPPSPTPTWRVLRAPFSVLSRARRFNPVRWRDDPRFTQFDRTLNQLRGDDSAALPWQDLVREVRTALRLVDPITALRISYLPAMGVAFIRLRLALARVRRLPLMADLVTGARTVTTEGNERLVELAEIVHADDRLKTLFGHEDADQTLVEVHSRPEFAAFAAELTAYIADYGHRETTSPVLASAPTWSDAPHTVIGLIGVLAAEAVPRPAATRAADALAQLFTHPRMQSDAARAHMLARINAARAGIAFREDSHDAFTRVVPILRRTLLELGARMRDAGILGDPFDIFHLRLDEIEAIDDLDAITDARRATLTALVRARAVKREQLTAVPMVDYAAIFGRAHRVENALVSGAPAGGGRATGVVRVVTTPDEFGTVKPGEILVCPYTNPAWTPLFQRAAAVVVDTGGIGSHAAIVAREIGIPAVMGTGNGTRVLSPGQRVTVDGTSGAVIAA